MTTIDGFYAAYLTGASGQGFAILVLRKGTIVGADAFGVQYDGTYKDIDNGYAVKLSFSIPPNTSLIQGVSTGAQIETSEIELQLPADFLAQPFIRFDEKHGPVNAKLVKLRDLNDGSNA